MKKPIKILLIVLVLALLAYLGYNVVTKMQQKKAIAAQLQTLPAFAFKTLNNTMFTNANLQAKKATIFIYFNSTCDFCQHEAQSISENLDQFSNVQFLFVSTEDTEIISQFATQYNLHNQPNITFLHDTTDTFTTAFGANSIPYLLIYDQSQNLIKKHKGQLNANGILKWLQP